MNGKAIEHIDKAAEILFALKELVGPQAGAALRSEFSKCSAALDLDEPGEIVVIQSLVHLERSLRLMQAHVDASLSCLSENRKILCQH